MHSGSLECMCRRLSACMMLHDGWCKILCVMLRSRKKWCKLFNTRKVGETQGWKQEENGNERKNKEPHEPKKEHRYFQTTMGWNNQPAFFLLLYLPTVFIPCKNSQGDRLGFRKCDTCLHSLCLGSQVRGIQKLLFPYGVLSRGSFPGGNHISDMAAHL